jgi:hypothetical protein
LRIESKPGEAAVFQAKEGGDIFLEIWFETRTLHLYRTVETLLWPSTEAIDSYADKPFFWSPNTGMMRILSEIIMVPLDRVKTEEHAERVMGMLEMYVSDYK